MSKNNNIDSNLDIRSRLTNIGLEKIEGKPSRLKICLTTDFLRKDSQVESARLDFNSTIGDVLGSFLHSSPYYSNIVIQSNFECSSKNTHLF